MTALCLLPFPAAFLLFELEHGKAHADTGFFTCAYCCAALVVSVILWARNRSKMKFTTVIFAVSTLIPYGVFCVARKIPLCAMCDGVTAEGLGFLARWISAGP